MDIAVKQMEQTDVIVVGGGIAGVAAAVASARQGAKTLLIEKTVCLGGLATIGLINWYEPLCDGEGEQLITGISEELIRLSVKYSYENLPAKWGGEGKNPIQYDRFATRFSPTIFALALIEYLEENNVKLRLDTLATYPEMEGSLCKGLLVETVSGREFFPAKMIIDATGDATVCHRAGIPTELGENYFSYVTHELSAGLSKKLFETEDFYNLRHWRNVGSSLGGKGHPEGMGMIKVTSADVITDYMTLGAKRVLAHHKQMDKNKKDILTLPTMPQFRKIRRIIGDGTFMGTEDGVILEDSVGRFGDFRKSGKRFCLAYNTLYNSCVDNIFAAGRIISAKDEGWEITRVIPVAALTGQVAGTAAALCINNGCSAAKLEVKELQRVLSENGVKIK